MITKEYRIPMPLSVEEYRIAQLYMIAKKSKIESEGQGSGVEIVDNRPYEVGPAHGPGQFGPGQFTHKLYHIGAHLPVWLRGFLPKSLSVITEEAWNAYPYSKNRIYTPYLDRFSIEIESRYLVGGTNRENVFDLGPNEVSKRAVDVIDFVNEKLYGADNVEDEDPLTYVSKKTSRGPLTKDWLESFESSNKESSGDGGEGQGEGETSKDDSSSGDKKGESESEATSSETKQGKKDFMCVYKICHVDFDRWPIQSKVEQYIHDYIRKTLVRAHRQAWAWQDEWYGLSIEQIREMERETQESLQKMMHPEVQ